MANPFQVASTTQLGLFGEPGAAEVEEVEGRPRPTDDKPVWFKRADPRTIFIGNARLDEYLREAGGEWVLRFAEFLVAQDWSEFEAAYRGGGRSPYPPARIAGLILYGHLKGATSLRELERLARFDVGAMWVSGGLAPNYSTLCRFMLRHEELIGGTAFEAITAAVLKRVDGSVREVAIDGTTVQAAASRYRRFTEEAARNAAEEAHQAAQAKPNDPALARKAGHAEQVARVAHERAQARRAKGRAADKPTVSPTEPEAAVQQLKDKSVAPSYKASLAVTEQRIIVAHDVHATSETVVLPKLIEQAERVGNEPVRREMLDAGYNCASVLQHAVDNDIDVLCPEGNPKRSDDWEKVSDKQFPKSKFVYDPKTDSYICPADKRLKRQFAVKNTAQPYTRYGTKECDNCPLKSQCTRGRRRTIKRYAGDELKDAQRQVMKHPLARKRYVRRQAWVEPAFAQLKNDQRLRRFRRRGLRRAKLEVAIHAIAHNIGRLLALVAAAASSRATGATRAALRPILALLHLLWVLQPTNPSRAPLPA